MASVIGNAILRTQSDERLVDLARTGHGRAFEAISERYRGELTRSLRRILPPGSVEDALQQTHLQAWKALSGGTEVRQLRAWLHQIARNAATAVASRGYDYDELEDALLVTPGPEHDLERREAVRRALRGIAELPERQRDALLAVAVGGRSHAEVALELGITDTAARQLVRRARVSLLAVASIATPPQLVRWAARAGHSMVVGKAAAGTGLGGSLAGSALKVGAVAVTVGGVAVGVAPIQHALAPPPAVHVAHHHRHTARAGRSVYLAAAVKPAGRVRHASATTTSTRPAAGPVATTVGHHGPHRVRRVSLDAIGKTVPVPAASPVTPTAPPTPVATTPTAPATAPAAATPTPTLLAALVSWWYAHQAQAATLAAGQSASPSPSQTSPSGPFWLTQVRREGAANPAGCTQATGDPSRASAPSASSDGCGAPGGSSGSAPVSPAAATGY
jgi:RNA polymerase sigma factor (sigma-70 family)